MEYLNTASWGWPQFIYLALTAIGIGVLLAKHGTLKTGKHDAFSSIAGTAVVFAILYYGRFWG